MIRTPPPDFSSSPYLRVPYVTDGRDWSGADCWGLVRLFYRRELGVELPSYAYGDTAPHIDVEAWEDVEQPGFGDVMLCQMFGELHSGVMLSARELLNTREGLRFPAIEDVTLSYWRLNPTMGFYRYVG